MELMEEKEFMRGKRDDNRLNCYKLKNFIKMQRTVVQLSLGNRLTVIVYCNSKRCRVSLLSRCQRIKYSLTTVLAHSLRVVASVPNCAWSIDVLRPREDPVEIVVIS